MIHRLTRGLAPFAYVSALALGLGACGSSEETEETSEVAAKDESTDHGYETYSDDNLADTMASNDEPYMGTMDDEAASSPSPSVQANEGESEDSEKRPTMKLQVVLDRAGFGPGVIDGKMGMSTRNAISGFQEANDLQVTGKLNGDTEKALARWDRIPATRVVTVPQSWNDVSYTDIPENTAAKAELDRMGYKSLDEKLAERFHTTIDVLQRLNPGGLPAGIERGQRTGGSDVEDNPPPTARPGDSIFKAGQQVRVPNVGADRIAPGAIDDGDWQRTLAALGVGTEQPSVDRIVVSKSGDTLKAYNGDTLVSLFTVSSGSSQFPLPLGEWDILGEAYNPPYSYDPEVLGQGEGQEYTFPPGPNNPVGIVWIDLSKEHYGIHGTPDPETIGRAQSSGCVRLTNWDAARLAQMVSPQTRVIFEA